jgi:hypothetical protein
MHEARQAGLPCDFELTVRPQRVGSEQVRNTLDTSVHLDFRRIILKGNIYRSRISDVSTACVQRPSFSGLLLTSRISKLIVTALACQIFVTSSWSSKTFDWVFSRQKAKMIGAQGGPREQHLVVT